jgi:hypothetical protein
MAEKRKRRTKQEMQEEYRNTSEYLSDGIYVAQYIGKEIMGFKKGQQYTFKLTKRPNEAYQLEELQEGLHIIYSSTISIKQSWKEIKEDN